jgi:hypothetical protein
MCCVCVCCMPVLRVRLLYACVVCPFCCLAGRKSPLEWKEEEEEEERQLWTEARVLERGRLARDRARQRGMPYVPVNSRRCTVCNKHRRGICGTDSASRQCLHRGGGAASSSA